MIKFNDDGIISNYIKQLLHTFNLPTPTVYVEGKTALSSKKLYIKDNFVCSWSPETSAFKLLFPYNYNKENKNYTRTLTFNNMLYNSHTHEYLGAYLRFLRDYNKLDLMSLYNCFSNNIYEGPTINFSLADNTSIYFETNSAYKVYSFPVKLGAVYTIAIESATPYEIFCGLQGKDFIPTDLKIESKTYQLISASRFNDPFLYSKVAAYEENDEYKIPFAEDEILEKEDCLRMFIKLPVENLSSITVLEGDYHSFNSRVPSDQGIFSDWSNNSVVNNFEADAESSDLKPISSLQLLYLNSQVSHPFADRLVEYLCGNVIDNMDNISDNIKRLQQSLKLRHDDGKTGWAQVSRYPGVWDDKYRKVLYSIAKAEKLLDKNFDILGYDDKDLEKILLPYEPDLYTDK